MLTSRVNVLGRSIRYHQRYCLWNVNKLLNSSRADTGSGDESTNEKSKVIFKKRKRPFRPRSVLEKQLSKIKKDHREGSHFLKELESLPKYPEDNVFINNSIEFVYFCGISLECLFIVLVYLVWIKLKFMDLILILLLQVINLLYKD